jgi:hypothetical protein
MTTQPPRSDSQTRRFVTLRDPALQNMVPSFNQCLQELRHRQSSVPELDILHVVHQSQTLCSIRYKKHELRSLEHIMTAFNESSKHLNPYQWDQYCDWVIKQSHIITQSISATIQEQIEMLAPQATVCRDYLRRCYEELRLQGHNEIVSYYVYLDILNYLSSAKMYCYLGAKELWETILPEIQIVDMSLLTRYASGYDQSRHPYINSNTPEAKAHEIAVQSYIKGWFRLLDQSGYHPGLIFKVISMMTLEMLYSNPHMVL